MLQMTPRQIVTELDRHIIGQGDAKRAVAVAIRNRWRRRQLAKDMAGEVYPKNIIMIGPTGVGKTEIARRLATLTGSPFVKVEASKYTEVGYHGRDVESMIRDLLDQGIAMVREEHAKVVKEKATAAAADRLVDLLLPPAPSKAAERAHEHDADTSAASDDGESKPAGWVSPEDSQERVDRTRNRLKEQLATGKLDEREVELTVNQKPAANVMFANMGLEQMDPEMTNMFERLIPEQTETRKVTVAQAREILIEQETEKLLDKDKITADAISRTEQEGIVFLDEIDKIATGGEGKGGPDVSRQGVQRDLLPIVEGSAVSTRHGVVHTDHILFVAAGAFHVAAVSDLMPELQGRFPIRVELSALSRDDFVRILTEPDNALTKQQQAMLKVEGIEVTYEDGAIEAIADLAAQANASLQNIGARRLMTVVEKVFEEIDFEAPDRVAAGETRINITADFVRKQVAAIVADEDLSKFVL